MSSEIPLPQTDKPEVRVEDGQIINERSPLIGMLGNSLINERVSAHVATHDLDTGLLNKLGARLKIQDLMNQDKTFGLVFIDLDAFKRVNDELGHGAGDELLARFGAHLNTHDFFKRKGEFVAHEKEVEEVSNFDDGTTAKHSRWGGDEFLVVVNLDDQDEQHSGRHDELTPEQRMEEQMEYIRTIFAEFVDTQPEEIKAQGFNISIGSAVFKPGDEKNPLSLIKRADDSMYEDKQSHNGAR